MSGVREGYAEVGDQRSALRRGRRGAAGRPAARLPRVLVRLGGADPAARGGGIPRRGTRHARLQPVVAAERGRGLRRRQARRRHPRSHPRARRGDRDAGRVTTGRGTIAWTMAMHHPEVVERVGDPQRRPPAEAIAGTAPPGPAPQVLGTSSSSISRNCRKPSCTPTTGTSSGTS